MATTVAALSDERLESELKQLATEALTVRGKINADTQKLDAARAERSRIVNGIATGTVKESEGPRIEAAIRQLEILLEGNSGVLAANRAKSEELSKELYRRQAEANKAAHEKRFAELNEKMTALALRIREKLTRLVTEDLREFEELRGVCVTGFPDLSGRDASVKALEILFKPSHPSEALRNPEVHLAQLDAAGWVPFGYQVMDRPVSLGGGFNVFPGPPLRLSIVSMRPKTPGS